MEWTTRSQNAAELQQAGYQVFQWREFRNRYVEPVDRIDVARKSLDTAAAAAIHIFEGSPAIAILNVSIRNYWDLRALYGFVIEPAYRNSCRLVVHADRELDSLIDSMFVEPEFGYAWTLERLRHLATRFRRRSIDANHPPMTPIEEMLLAAFASRGLVPRIQYGIGRFRADFAFPERLLVVEADGRGWHDVHRDRLRDETLGRQGWQVLRFTGSQIFRDAAKCAETVAAAYTKRPEAPDYSDVSSPEGRQKRSWWRAILDWLKWLFSSETLARAPEPEPDPLPPEPQGAWCDGLDDAQREAVLAHEGVVQVIAPAGSGKTRVLVSRVRQLVARGVPEERILCTTFNKATEKELKARLEQVGIGAAAVRTFHSIGHHILREEGKLRGEIGTLTYSQWRRLAKVAMDEEEGRVWLEADKAAEAVSNYKLAQMISPDIAWKRAATMVERTAARIYALYEEALERTDRNDFDDLVLNALQLLRKDPDARQRWQDVWECVLVDEYQDIEPAQELLVQILAAPEDSLFVVGDEDQCIYTWRRAEVERIVNLDKRYPGLERSVLTTCYRCPADVVEAASKLIQNNARRFPKKILAGRAAPERDSVMWANTSGGSGESLRHLVAQLRRADPSETVVLARTSQLLRDVALACHGARIPFKASERVVRPAQSESTVQSYLRLLATPHEADSEDVRKAFRVPNRYLPQGAEHGIVQRLKAGKSFSEAVSGAATEEWRRKALSEGAALLDRASRVVDAVKLLHMLRTEGGLDGYYSGQEKMLGHDQIEIDTLDALAADFAGKRPAEALAMLSQRGEALAGASTEDGIELTTFHGAKGREWSQVFLYGWDQDQLPHHRGVEEAATQEDRDKVIEDERRLAYVALTRSTSTVRMYGITAPVSQFAAEAGLVASPRIGDVRRATAAPVAPLVTKAAEAPARYKPRRTAAAGKPKRSGPLIKSKYDNRCSACGGAIKVGDWICPVLVSGSTRWVHARCARD